MKGKDRFTSDEADRIRALLKKVRLAERSRQKTLRAAIRRIGFHISDWSGSSAGFTASDFDDLVQRGLITIEYGPRASLRRAAAPETQRLEKPASSVATWSEVRSALQGPGMPVPEAISGAVPDAPELYAIHGNATAWELLTLGAPPDDRPCTWGRRRTVSLRET